jgi:hypothetical protein
MNLEELKKRRQAIAEDEEKCFSNLDKVVAENKRVEYVAGHSREILDNIEEQFERYTGLNGVDIAFLFTATALQIGRQYLVTHFPERKDDQTAAKEVHGEEHSSRHSRYYDISVEDIISNPVPFDANIGANGALSGGGSMGHRVTALGHDPLLGLVVGTSNIATSTLTNNRFQSYHIRTNEMGRDFFANEASTPLVFSKTANKLMNEGLEGKKKVGTSLVKEVVHLKSDINTKNSLPLPAVSVINPQLASTLAERGLDMCNVVTVGKQAAYSVLVNTMIAMIHGLFYKEAFDGSRKLYEVKTRKILSYSNLIASTSNLIFVGANMALGNESAIKQLDIGGLMVTIYRVATDSKFIHQLKREFIENEFLSQIKGTEFDF